MCLECNGSAQEQRITVYKSDRHHFRLLWNGVRQNNLYFVLWSYVWEVPIQPTAIKFCIVALFLGSSNTAHCHKFCTVVLYLGSSNTAHCHKFCTVLWSYFWEVPKQPTAINVCIVVLFLGSFNTAHCHKFCIVVLYLGSSNTAHCHKFCTVVLFLGSSETAHGHKCLYCSPLSRKFQYSPLS